MKNKITTIIVVHNEEKFIRKCLESIKELSEEIIIIHDGRCRDRSLEIASEFTDKIFEGERCGALEPHLVHALRIAKNNWIMRLDVDEHLSQELNGHIRRLDFSNTPFTHFKALWRGWKNGRIIRQSPYSQKILIFNKNHSICVGIPHQAVSCSGEALVLDGYLEHTPDHISYGFLELILRKLKPLAQCDAKLRFASPVKIHSNLPGLSNLRRNIIRNRHPFLTMPLFACGAYFKSLWELRTARDPSVFKTIFVFSHGHLLYQVMLSHYLCAEKRKLKRQQRYRDFLEGDKGGGSILYDEEYFEKGLITGKSCYVNYRWMPELTIRMFYYMVKDLPIHDGAKILDYGCAKGYLVRAARILNFEAYGVDVSEYAISKADPEVKDYCKLIRNGEGTQKLFNIIFDWVISKDVFEHITEQELPSLIQDLSLATRKMFVVVPVAKNDTSRKFVVPDYDKDRTHFTIKSDRWWVRLFSDNGFTVERMDYQFRFCKENWTSVHPKGNTFYVLKSNVVSKDGS